MFSVFNATQDCSTFANFYGFSAPVSAFLAACGWIQTADTNQPMWTGLTITAASVSVTGSVGAQTVICPYTSLVGLAPAVGRAFNITGFTGTFSAVNYSSATPFSAAQITAVTVSSSTTGSFSFVYTGVTSLTGTATGSPVVTQASAVPGISTAYTEIWGMGDNTSTGSAFYMSLSYKEGSSNTYGFYSIQMGTGSTGLGVLSGNTGASNPIGQTEGTTTVGEFDISGGVNWFCFIAYRLPAIANVSKMMAVERQRTSTGAAGTSYVTVLTSCINAGNGLCTQQSIFQVGAGTSTTQETGNDYRWATVLPVTSTTGTVNNQTLVSPVYPLVGYIDNPHMMVVVGLTADYTEGSIITVNIYGGNHNYLYTKAPNNGTAVGNQGLGFPAIRWE